MLAIAEDRPSKTSMSVCNVFLSFKYLLVFIYEIIYFTIRKLSGEKSISSFSNGSITHHPTEKIDIAPPKRLKEVSELPGPRPLPFFGTLLTSSGLNSNNLMNANEGKQKLTLQRNYGLVYTNKKNSLCTYGAENERKYGKIMKEEHFWNFPLVMVLGGEAIKKIIRSNPVGRPGMEILDIYRAGRPDIYHTFGLVNSQGKTWRELHAVFAPVTSSMKFIRTMLPTFNDIANDLNNELARLTTPTTEFPRLLTDMITEISFLNVFGTRMGVIGEKRGELGEMLKLFSNCHEKYWAAFHKSMYGFPWWKYFPTKVWSDFVAAEKIMFSTISELTEKFLETDEGKGVLGAIDRGRLLKQDVNVVLLELVTGATEPVLHSTLLVLYWVTRYDHVYNKIMEELLEQMPTKDTPVDDNLLRNIPYLKACVTEAFRICPATPNIARILEKEMEVEGYRLPAGTVAIVQAWHACLNEENFYQAKEFLPERWVLVNGAPPFKPHDRQVMCNFGFGLRTCPGRKLAIQFIYTFLCKTLRRFKLKFAKEPDVRYEWLQVVKGPVSIDLKEYET